MKKIIAILTMLAAATGLYAQGVANLIYFTTSEYFDGHFSDGTPWAEDSMTFEGGTFADGILPVLSNGVLTGASSWTPLPLIGSDDSYPKWEVDPIEGPSGIYYGYVNFQSNDAPFAVGTPLYTLGYNGASLSESTEWILFGNSSWETPVHGQLGGAAELWLELTDAGADNGSHTINGIGSIDVPNQMLQSIPEPSTYALIFGLGILGFLGIRRVRN